MNTHARGPAFFRRVAVAAAAAVALLIAGHLDAQVRSIPVMRDEAISEVSYAAFEGKSAEEIWQALDALDFWAVPLSPPPVYYAAVDDSTADRLRQTLHERIRAHRVYPYTTSSRPGQANHAVDTWDIIAIADAHPEQPAMVLDVYLNGLFPRQLAGTTASLRYDREHSWPKSLGFPSNALSNPAYSDCHHLFAAYSSYNGSRSNKPYGDGPPSAHLRRPTLENVGRGGSLEAGDVSSNFSFRDVWQTWLGRRGDVARAMMYMDVRYEGPYAGSASEADLALTDDPADIQTGNAAASGGTANMGLLSALVRWHEEDPVDDLERRRNTVVHLFQGNRNPFVDHPEWVAAVYGSTAAAPPAVQPWINEFHYDNVGRDEGEFVEIAGPAGLDLAGWKVLGYNGSGGKVYRTISLSGTVPDQMNGFGVLAFDFPGMQNGPDGLALVDGTGGVVELLSYEGTFTATGGPATGMDAVLIPVEESGTTPLGFSLQLGGTGTERGGFAWEGPVQATRGAVNANQQFGD